MMVGYFCLLGLTRFFADDGVLLAMEVDLRLLAAPKRCLVLRSDLLCTKRQTGIGAEYAEAESVSSANLLAIAYLTHSFPGNTELITDFLQRETTLAQINNCLITFDPHDAFAGPLVPALNQP